MLGVICLVVLLQLVRLFLFNIHNMIAVIRYFPCLDNDNIYSYFGNICVMEFFKLFFS
jgi:hypothetical protein